VIEEDAAGGLDFRALCDATEGSDAVAQLGFYSDDAELRVVNADSPQGPAFELRGSAHIEKYLHAVCGRGMTCTVSGEELGVEIVSFIQKCEYPDGTRILVRTTLELGGGRSCARSTWWSAHRDGKTQPSVAGKTRLPRESDG
jgi:hypothetical protein